VSSRLEDKEVKI